MKGAVFTCRDCHKSGPYYHTPKRLDPRPHVGTRVVCQDCAIRYKAEIARKQAFTAGGPYRGDVGSKGGGASEHMASYWNGKAGAIRRKVYDYLQSNPPAGAEDIARAINEHPDNVSPRISELTKAQYGFLLAKGPRTARTRMGSLAHVYQINQEAA